MSDAVAKRGGLVHPKRRGQTPSGEARPNTPAIATALIVACGMALFSASVPLGHWGLFLLYLCLGVISAGFKLQLPGSGASLSFNVPYILLAISCLSLPQALVVAIASTLVICSFRVSPPNTPLQFAVNIANAVNAAGFSWMAYQGVYRASHQLLPAFVCSGLVYFVVNSLTIAAIVAPLQRAGIFHLWRTGFVWSLPYYTLGALLAAASDHVARSLGLFTAQMVLPLTYMLYRICRSYADRLHEKRKHASDMAALHLRTIEALAMAIEAKDENTHEHLCRVRVYALGIADELGLSPDEREALVAAALLHDIGKLAVPEHIINKPGKLTPEEFEKMKIHPVVGADILERVAFPYPVCPIVRSHHERWNGTGYPDGLKGEEIPIGARILSAVDCFDALASDRPYRRALPLDEVMLHVQKESGISFDPRVVALLADNFKQLEAKARSESSKMTPLPTGVVVRRGDAPSAGFEQSAPASALPGGAQSSLSASHDEQVLAKIRALLPNTRIAIGAIEQAASHLVGLIPFELLIVLRKDGDVLAPVFVSHADAQELLEARVVIGTELCGWVAQSHKPIVNANPAVEITLCDRYPAIAAMHSALAVPVLDPQGDLAGVLALYRREKDAFSRDQLRIAQSIEATIGALVHASRTAQDEKAQQFERVC